MILIPLVIFALGAGELTSATTTICLAPASAQLPTANNADAAVAVQESFKSFLTGPTLRTTALQARISTQVRQEARQSKCGYLLFVTLKGDRKKSSGGTLGRIAGGAAQHGAYSIGISGGSVAGRVAAGAVTGAAIAAASNLATSTKIRDELELSYRLESAAGAVVRENRSKRKAKADGEDLLTPLVEQASEQIAAAVAK